MTSWLAGDVALVTGAGSGIGRAVAERFVAEGARVVVLDRDRDRAEAVVAACARPEAMLAVAADVRDSGQLHDAVDAALARFGKLDVLVANAGVWDFQRTVTRVDGPTLAAMCDEMFAVNVKGYLLAVESCWRALVASRGSVVMTLSNSSFHVNGGGPIYTASKHACLGLMRELAYELAPRVRVNGVACGGMNTDLRGPESAGLGGRSIAASFARHPPDSPPPPIPLHDSSTDPRAFTGPYVLLASRSQSSVITGHAIAADGGIAVRGFTTAAGGDAL